MPTYDYVCHHCGHRFEVVHGVHDLGPTTCPACHEGPVRKAFSPPSIHFKGSGWAKKDRRATAKPAASSVTEEAAPKAGSGPESGAAKEESGAAKDSSGGSTGGGTNATTSGDAAPKNSAAD
jgi:putative FmdB family regulatory protein